MLWHTTSVCTCNVRALLTTIRNYCIYESLRTNDLMFLFLCRRKFEFINLRDPDELRTTLDLSGGVWWHPNCVSVNCHCATVARYCVRAKAELIEMMSQRNSWNGRQNRPFVCVVCCATMGKKDGTNIKCGARTWEIVTQNAIRDSRRSL